MSSIILRILFTVKPTVCFYNLNEVLTMNIKQKDKYILLGLNIAHYRKLNGFTQEKLAEALNLDRTTISKIELATSGVSLDVIFEMCDLFSIPPSKLFDFRD